MSIIDGTILAQAEARKIYQSIPASYNVYKSGSTYYANSTTAGGTDYSGLDADVVIQDAIDAMNEGEKLFIMGGTYNVDTQIDIDNRIHISGESNLGTILNATSDITIFDIPDLTSLVTLEHLYLGGLGASSTKPALKIGYGFNHVNHLRIDNFDTAIEIGIGTEGSESIHIEGGFYLGWKNRAIYAKGAANGLIIDGANRFAPPLVLGSEVAAIDVYGSDPVIIRDNVFSCFCAVQHTEGKTLTVLEGNYWEQGSPYHNGARFFNQIPSTAIAEIKGNLINGGDETDPAKVSYGLVLAGYATVDANRFYHCRVAVQGATTCLVERGLNYFDSCTTEYNIFAPGGFTGNSGYSTGNDAQQTIAHGCGFTPTASQVFLSERTTGGALARQTAAPDNTNIYITATADKDYNWLVKKSF